MITASSRLRQSGSIRTGRRACRGQRALRPLQVEGLAVDLRQQIVEVGGDEIDDAQFDRLLRRQADGFAHRLLGPFDVAAAQLRESADISARICDHLAMHRIALRLRRLLRLAVLAFTLVLGLGGQSSGLLSGCPGIPPIWTGVAAPRLVAGAIAAMWLA